MNEKCLTIFFVQIGWYLGRRANFGTQNFMGFDQVELYQIKRGVVTDEMTGPAKTSYLSSQTKTTESQDSTTTEEYSSIYSVTKTDLSTTDETPATQTITSTSPTSTDLSTSADFSTWDSTWDSTIVSSKSTTAITTTTSSPSSTTSKNGGSTEEKVKVLGCSFDVTDPLCTLKFRTNGSTVLYSISQTSSQAVGSYRVTDVTSISKLEILISNFI